VVCANARQFVEVLGTRRRRRGLRVLPVNEIELLVEEVEQIRRRRLMVAASAHRRVREEVS